MMVSTMEPENVLVFGSMPKTQMIQSSHLVCTNFSRLTNASVFYSSSPLTLMLPLLLLQLSLGSAAILVTFYLLRHFGLPLMLAQVLVTSLSLPFPFPFPFAIFNATIHTYHHYLIDCSTYMHIRVECSWGHHCYAGFQGFST